MLSITAADLMPLQGLCTVTTQTSVATVSERKVRIQNKRTTLQQVFHSRVAPSVDIANAHNNIFENSGSVIFVYVISSVMAKLDFFKEIIPHTHRIVFYNTGPVAVCSF